MAQKFNFKKVTGKGELKGACHTYTVAGGTVTVGFTTTMAYVMEDTDGLYEAEDIKYNINEIGLEVEGVKETKEIYNIEGRVEPKFSEIGISSVDEADIKAKLIELNTLEGIND